MQGGVLRPRVLVSVCVCGREREEGKKRRRLENTKTNRPSLPQVVATTPEACALLRPAAEAGTLAGSIILPGTSLAGLCLPPGGPSDATCCLHWAGDETTTLIALARAPPSPERSPAIADALLTAVDTDAVVVVGCVPAHVVPGGGDDDTVFTLPSSTAAPPAATTPLLPPGVALTGLTAALFSRRQAGGRPAVALASVDACAGAPGGGCAGVTRGRTCRRPGRRWRPRRRHRGTGQAGGGSRGPGRRGRGDESQHGVCVRRERKRKRRFFVQSVFFVFPIGAARSRPPPQIV